MSISNIRPSLPAIGLPELRSTGKPAAPTAPQELNFGKMLDSLSQSQGESDTLMQKLAAGEEVDLHSVMIATEETDINFRIAMAIRDKLVEAYRETMRMNV